jgi:hypothetical protein
MVRTPLASLGVPSRFFAWLKPWLLQDRSQRFLLNVSDLVIGPKGRCNVEHFLWQGFLRTPQGKALGPAMEVF